jgi:hypothetical protein
VCKLPFGIAGRKYRAIKIIASYNHTLLPYNCAHQPYKCTISLTNCALQAFAPKCAFLKIKETYNQSLLLKSLKVTYAVKI